MVSRALGGIAVVAMLVAVLPASGSTLVPLGFDEVASRAGIVVQGTVVDLRVVEGGAGIQQTTNKFTTAPQSPVSLAAPADPTSGAAPRAVRAAGGRMPVTEVTLAVERAIVGTPGATVTFQLAGGDLGDRKVFVDGLPRFERGGRYVVFLKPEHETAVIPVVGANQGCFEVVRDAATGEERILNAEGQIVVGVAGGRVRVKRDPERAGPGPMSLGDAPVPAAGSRTTVRLTPEVARYWRSEEPAMTLDDFAAAVLAAREGRP